MAGLKMRQLEAFRAVMAHGGISRAAEALGISQPATSRLIADLEAHVGFALFQRRKGGMEPTPEAVTFFHEVEHTFLGLERLEQAAREIRSQQRGHIRIAVLPAVSLMIAPRIIGRFQRSHPDIKVTIEVLPSSQIVDLVSAGDYHLGICQIIQPAPYVRVLRRFHTECVCVMVPEHPLAGADEITPERLAGETMISFAPHTLAALHVNEAFSRAGVELTSTVDCHPSYLSCMLASERLGVSIVDPMTARSFAGGRLAVRPFRPALPFDVCVIQPVDAQMPRIVRSFLEGLWAELEGDPDVSLQPDDMLEI